MADIEAIRARWAAVTSGPWRACGANDGACKCGLIWDATESGPVAIVTRDTTVDGGDVIWSDEAYRAHFAAIGHAPQDVAALLAALDDAEARAAALREVAMLAQSMADFSRRHSAPYGFEVVGQGDMMALDKALAALAAQDGPGATGTAGVGR